MSKTNRVRQEVAKCWALLKRDRIDERTNQPVDPLDEDDEEDDPLVVRQLKNTFKFYNSPKMIKSLMALDAPIHRVAITQECKFIYGGGLNCKIRKRDFNIQTCNVQSEKSRVKSY